MSTAPSPLPTGGAPVAPPTGGGGSFRGLIAQKEKELHDINEYRIHTLETLLQEKETAEANTLKVQNVLESERAQLREGLFSLFLALNHFKCRISPLQS